MVDLVFIHRGILQTDHIEVKYVLKDIRLHKHHELVWSEASSSARHDLWPVSLF